MQGLRQAILAGILGTAALSAQAPAPAPEVPKAPAANPNSPPPIKWGSVTVSGSLRSRFENWNFFDSTAADGEYNFSGNILRLSFAQKTDNYDWQIEAAVPFLIGLPQNAVAPPPGGALGLGANYFQSARGEYAAAIFPKQAFIRIVGTDDRATTVRLGRFEFIEGLENQQKNPDLAFLKRERIGHRLVGNFAFTHVGRSFDGLEFKRDTGTSNLTVMGGRATRGVFQVDGLGELDVDIAYMGFTRQLNLAKKHPAEWRVFVLHYHDGRTGSLTTKLDNRPLAVRSTDHYTIRLATVGAHYAQLLEARKMKADLVLWAALQLGAWGAMDQRAASFDVEAGLQPDWAWKPWFRGGFSYSTGDNNPNDGKNGTFFEPLGTPRIYARFPFYNHMNMQDVFGQLILRPSKRLTLRSEGHYLQLANANDFWYSGGGAFAQRSFGMAGRPSGGSTDLGTLFDVGADWNVNRNLTFSAYYAHAIGGKVIRNIFPTRADADYAYLEMVYRF